MGFQTPLQRCGWEVSLSKSPNDSICQLSKTMLTFYLYVWVFFLKICIPSVSEVRTAYQISWNWSYKEGCELSCRCWNCTQVLCKSIKCSQYWTSSPVPICSFFCSWFLSGNPLYACLRHYCAHDEVLGTGHGPCTVQGITVCFPQ